MRHQRRFGEFLVRRGLVTDDQLQEALRIQDANMVAIGALAVQSRVLTRLQVHQVLERQQRTLEPFGTAAEALGFCDSRLIDGLAGQQQDMVPLIGHVLVILGYLGEEALTVALKDFES